MPNGIDLSHSVENEYFCLMLTRALGLPSASVEMANFEGKNVLVVERFDRRFTRDKRLLRLPQEDCCQALSIPWTRKYESDGGPGIAQILPLLAGSDEAQSDRRTFLKAIIVIWLLAATDGHAKNFSLALMPGGGYHLTPLYDIVSAQPSLDARQIRRNKMKMAMAIGDTRRYAVDTIAGRHFVQTAVKSGMGKIIADEVIDSILAEMPAALDRVQARLPRGFPEELSTSITRGVQSRLALLARSRR